MKKRFNITGVCIPDRHYMMDTSKKMKAVLEMIEFGEYFTINRPRQYGKTTMLFLLEEYLGKTKDYLAIKTSFEAIGDLAFENEQTLSRTFLGLLHDAIVWENPVFAKSIQDKIAEIHHLTDLSKVISQLVRESQKKVVVLIDEVDASSNDPMFLKLLAMLRNKYLNRSRRGQETFHSVILAGVHDIKTLKLRLRPDDQRQYNSPWNIAADFEVVMRFHPPEIAPMLEEYGQAEGVAMDVPAIAERLYYYTSGYPFLVSKLCKIIAEKFVPVKEMRTWTLEEVENAVNLLLRETNTNFDSLIKNLENNEELYDLVYRVIIEGEEIIYNPDNPLIHHGVLYGIFKNDSSLLKVHNRAYEQRIYNYMTSKTELKVRTNGYNFQNQFILKDRRLDVKKILLKFQQFMQEQYSEKDTSFLERHGRLVFLSFLKPIINGGGHDFKEVQASEEKRLDIVVTFFRHKYIIELKRWYGDAAHQKGIRQLGDYLDRQHQQKGYLLIFEHKTKKTWRKEEVRQGDKDIFAVWV